MRENLKNKKLFLFDLDGTIYKENKLFQGARELFERIKEKEGRYVFITNNSSKSIKDYIEKISNMGIEVDYDNFYTSTQVTIEYLRDRYNNKLVFCVGTESFINELKKNNINVTSKYDDEADLVLLGFDTELNYNKVKDICKILNKKPNIPYIATNQDLACPAIIGFIPDCGAIAKMIECATGRLPIFLGKPDASIVNNVIEKFGNTKEETLVIGDRLYTDIAAGLNAGVSTICVLTGEATQETIDKSNIKPHMVLEAIKELIDII